jgi:hypothetical protein
MATGRAPCTWLDSLRRLRQRKIDNIKMDIQEMGWVGVGLIEIVQDSENDRLL